LNRLYIAVDFDDVIVQTVPDVITLLNDRQHEDLYKWSVEDVTEWDIGKITGFGDETIKQVFNQVDYREVAHEARAVENIRNLIDYGHSVTVVTANPREIDIRGWMDRNGLRMVPLVSVTDKVSWMEDRGFNVIVDDNPQTLQDASAMGYHALRFERPWNAGISWGFMPNEYSVRSWFGVMDAITSIVEKDQGLRVQLSYAVRNDLKMLAMEWDPDTIVNENGAKQSRIDGAWTLLPMRALESVARVLREGAAKYGADNWRGLSVDEINDHVWAHLATWQMTGETEELEHAACRVLMALEIAKGGGNEKQDTERPSDSAGDAGTDTADFFGEC
jgi:5'(3')-deoxyribonucleotidase